MTVLYPNPGYNEVSYNGTALYFMFRVKRRVALLYCILQFLCLFFNQTGYGEVILGVRRGTNNKCLGGFKNLPCYGQEFTST